MVVGYAHLLLEGIVAVIAIGTVMLNGASSARAAHHHLRPGNFGKFASMSGSAQDRHVHGTPAMSLLPLRGPGHRAPLQIKELTNMKVDKYTATVITVAAGIALAACRCRPHRKRHFPHRHFRSVQPAPLRPSPFWPSEWVAKALKKDNRFIMVPM